MSMNFAASLQIPLTLAAFWRTVDLAKALLSMDEFGHV
jgi:hypothetical protein